MRKNLAVFICCLLLGSFNAQAQSSETSPQAFRQALLDYSRDFALHPAAAEFSLGLQSSGEWNYGIKIYYQGALKAEAAAAAGSLRQVIEKAAARAVKSSGLSRKQLKSAVFYIQAASAGTNYALIDYQGKALEAVGDLNVIRELTPQLIREKISQHKAYLLRVMHPSLHGFYKIYEADKDLPEKRLRTIYTASSLYTLLKIHDFDHDAAVLAHVPPIVGYLTSMQVQEGPLKGAFHYSYYYEKDKKEARFVVGTASKTIFTLIDLYQRTGRQEYLDTAKLAGDWLCGQVNRKGHVTPVVRLQGEKAWTDKRFSYLYSGQVLSALSRLYAVTQDKKYYRKAKKIAKKIIKGVKGSDYFVGDDFRAPNTISTSWSAQSLLDFAQATGNQDAKEAVFKCMDAIIRVQNNDPSDLLNYGRYDTYYSSGNGWINEVMGEVYKYGKQQGIEVEHYLPVMLKTTRWLLQNIYSKENTFHLPNPAQAIGGSIRNPMEENVRTDAVCHGGNSLVTLLEISGGKIAFSVPE